MLFELPTYVSPSDNRVIRDPIEQWLYFFCRADESTAEELATRLPDPVFTEATGVLEMIAKNPDERRLYNERLKMERDERARNLQAREEVRQEGELKGLQKGRQEGLQEGATIGRIQVLREINGLPSQSADELANRSADELLALEAELQRKLRDRG